MTAYKELVSRLQERIVQARRDLHRIPEPAFGEKKTAAYLAAYLQREGLKVRTGIARTGVVGLMETGRPGKTLLLRADMDALHIQEETGLPFASEHEGRMHACGHDCHMAMLLGAATALGELKGRLFGTVKFVFQPAEEGPGGAKPMIAAGVLDDPPVDYALGCHLWPELPAGTVGVKAGPTMAAMDRFDLKIIGKGGHGAMPHLCVDALEVGAQVVAALQRIVSRQMKPLLPAVVTVGSFHAGTAFNVIPGEAQLSGTTRTFDHDVWSSWHERVETVVAGVCRSMGAAYELTYTPGYPPLVNDEWMCAQVRRCAAATVGADKVREPEATMGGEDMAFFLQKAQGCFFFLGTGFDGAAGVHTSRFNPGEDVLLTGTEMYCRLAVELLGV